MIQRPSSRTIINIIYFTSRNYSTHRYKAQQNREMHVIHIHIHILLRKSAYRLFCTRNKRKKEEQNKYATRKSTCFFVYCFTKCYYKQLFTSFLFSVRHRRCTFYNVTHKYPNIYPTIIVSMA